MSEQRQRCTAATSRRLWNNPLSPRARCTRWAEEGAEFCSIHSPEAKEKRRQKAMAQWEARNSRIERENEAEHRRRVCEEACAGLPTEALESGALGKALEALKSCVDFDGRYWPDVFRDATDALRALGRL